jgi:hypothetical protein
MKKRQLQGRIGSAILGASMLLGVGIGVSRTARAQSPDYRQDRDRDRNDSNRGRDWDRYGNYGGSNELRHVALNAGYNEGSRQGREDRYRRNRTDFRNQTAYLRATKDYSTRLGDRELYRRYFREGYENGYNSDTNDNSRRYDRNRDGNDNGNGNQTRRGRNWDLYGNLGGSFQLRQTALNAGYNEGIKQGRNDRNKRNRSDFRTAAAYQKATKDYSSGLGDRELYRRYYREAYENGFDAGVNGY